MLTYIGNDWVNTAHIVSINQQGNRVILTKTGSVGESYYYANPQVASRVISNLQKEMLAVIPAYPGYAIVNLVDDEPRYLLEPIVGWQVDGTTCTPLTIGGIWSEDDCYVLTPLGRVESTGGASFDSMQDFVKAHSGKEA
jgi:hypothetical protein